VPLALRLAAAVVLVTGLAASRPVAADPKAACVHGAEEGQRLRAQSKLREAREAFTACAADRCPALVRSDCSGWLAEVEAAVPTVVVRASAAEEPARELNDVEVRVDGVVLASKLDGRELPLNPGEHHVSFSAAGRVPAEDDVVIRVGEKHRLLTVALASVSSPVRVTAPVPLPAPPRPRVSMAAKVLLIGGGLALAGGAALGTSAWVDQRSLRRDCAPGCPQGDVDSARLRLRLGDASMALGVAALAGAAVLIWTRPDDGSTVAVAPLAGGALVALRFRSRGSW
jgi:hypothetical protein